MNALSGAFALRGLPVTFLASPGVDLLLAPRLCRCRKYGVAERRTLILLLLLRGPRLTVMPRTKATQNAKPHDFAPERVFFHAREEAERIVMHAVEHLQLTNGETPDADGVLTLANELAAAHGVDVETYLLVESILRVADEYLYARERECAVYSFKAQRIDALIAEQHGIAAGDE